LEVSSYTGFGCDVGLQLIAIKWIICYWWRDL